MDTPAIQPPTGDVINAYEGMAYFSGYFSGQVSISEPAASKEGVPVFQTGGDRQLTWAETAALTPLSPTFVALPEERKAWLKDLPLGTQLEMRLGVPSQDFGAQAIWDRFKAIQIQYGDAAANEFAAEMIGILDSAAQVEGVSKKLALGTAHSLHGLTNFYVDPFQAVVYDPVTGQSNSAIAHGRVLLYDILGGAFNTNKMEIVAQKMRDMPLLGGKLPTAAEQAAGGLSASEVVLSRLDLRTPQSPGWDVIAAAKHVSEQEASGALPKGSTEAFFAAALDAMRLQGR